MFPFFPEQPCRRPDSLSLACENQAPHSEPPPGESLQGEKVRLRVSRARGGPGRSWLCGKRLFWTLGQSGFQILGHGNHKCLRMSQTLSSSRVWQKRARYYLLDRILTKTLALIGGPVNKDFG